MYIGACLYLYILYFPRPSYATDWVNETTRLDLMNMSNVLLRIRFKFAQILAE